MDTQSSATARPTTAHSLVGLDLLRAAAAITVFLVHVRGASFVDFGALPASQRTFFTAVAFGVTRLGHEAVMIFFVLSGYLVGGQVIRRVIAGRFSIADYAIDRSTRIFTVLWRKRHKK